MAYVGMAYIVMAYVVMAYEVMAYVVTAHVVIAQLGPLSGVHLSVITFVHVIIIVVAEVMPSQRAICRVW